MAKSMKLLKTAVLSATAAAALTAFLRSDAGKKARKSVVKFSKEYREDPQAKHEEFLKKAQEYSAQTYEKWANLKEQFQTGEVTVTDVVEAGKAKADYLRGQSVDAFDKVKEKIASQNLSTKDLLASIKEKRKS
ncbi:hypothetical protein [Streptococcus sp. DD13]|uniref:hypothetical protein n=1 Tax=Streptococcus sp. DD13 TaxID=1777881 RepID=UPI000796CAF5|nr:hypothetical protein [Streptococcus sp. DD13]KXT78455.1 putative general stress protein [Streptococcus sp. DD13]